jgi:Tfp pilus assembly protein PilF
MKSIRAALLLSLSLAACAAHAAIPFPSERERWLELRADEFTIYSNASEGKTVAIATELLRMRDALGRLTRLAVRSPLPTQVFVFTNERSFAPYRDAAMQRKNAYVSGIFLGGENGNLILIQADASAGVDRVVFHELTHYFVKNMLRGLPLWFNEGLAEYYSTFATAGTEVSLGKPIAEHVHWLRSKPLIPLRELFATTEDSPTYNETARQGVFYAQSWALVHYLLRGSEERGAQLTTFLGQLNAGRSIDDAFAASFKLTYAQLEDELQAYVRKFTFAYVRYSLADLAARELPKPQAMPRANVLAELGHLLAHSDPANAEEAERFLTEALQHDRDLAGVHGDLGRLHDLAGRTAEAERSYERAVQLGSNDVRIYLMYGSSLLQRFSRSDGQPAPAEVSKLRQLFTKSTQLDPKSARAWAGLGTTYVMSAGASDPGIAALEKSLALSPPQEDVAFNLVLLYARAGRRDAGVRVIDTVIARTGDPALLERSRQALLYADAHRIDTLLRANNYAEAVPLMKSVLAQTTDPALKDYLARNLRQLDEMNATNAIIDKLNSATEKANAGKYAEALALLDEVLPQITDGEMLARAKEFRSQVAKRVKRK